MSDDNLISLKVLQNQKAMIPPLADFVTFLYDAMPSNLGKVMQRSSYRGFLEGFAEFCISGRYDATITVGVAATFVFGFANRLFCCHRRHVAKELYFDETSLSLPIKRSLMRWALKNVDLIVTNSSAEIPYLMNLLCLERKRFEFIPWPGELPIPALLPLRSDYVFAGGRSFRDWPTLFEAVTATGLRTVVVASSKDMEGVHVPEEVELHLDLAHAEYLKLLESARIVVVPLKTSFRSIGQTAMLEAMALGKATIIASVPSVIDYVRPGINGLLYEPGDISSLRDVLLQLYKDEIRQGLLGAEAQKEILDKYNPIAYSHSMLKVMLRICNV